MVRRGKTTRRDIESCVHAGEGRSDSPPAGLVTLETDRGTGRNACVHAPRIDRRFSWGKTGHRPSEVPAVALCVAERMDPDGTRMRGVPGPQPSLLDRPGKILSFRLAVAFRGHRHNPACRAVAGDSLPGKEGLWGQFVLTHSCGSTLQPFANRKLPAAISTQIGHLKNDCTD